MTIKDLYRSILADMFGEDVLKKTSGGTNALKQYLYDQAKARGSAEVTDVYDAIQDNHVFFNCLKTVLNDLYVNYQFLIVNENGKNMMKYIDLHRLVMTSGRPEKISEEEQNICPMNN